MSLKVLVLRRWLHYERDDMIGFIIQVRSAFDLHKYYVIPASQQSMLPHYTYRETRGGCYPMRKLEMTCAGSGGCHTQAVCRGRCKSRRDDIGGVLQRRLPHSRLQQHSFFVDLMAHRIIVIIKHWLITLINIYNQKMS